MTPRSRSRASTYLPPTRRELERAEAVRREYQASKGNPRCLVPPAPAAQVAWPVGVFVPGEVGE